MDSPVTLLACGNPACGKPVEAAWSHCPHCGAVQMKPQPEPASVPTMQTNRIACPHCLSLHVQKASAIYSNGTWTGTSVATTHGTGYNSHGGHVSVEGMTFGYSQGQTNLAFRLQPPTPPHRTFYTTGLRVFYGILLGLLWSYALVAGIGGLILLPSGSGDGPGLVMGSVVASLFGYWLTAKYVYWQKEGQDIVLQQQRQNWYQDAMAQWLNLYYCYQCDSTFTCAVTT